MSTEWNEILMVGIPTLIITLFGIYITFRVTSVSNKIANDNLEKQLFTEFNKRYDKLNNKLMNIQSDKPLYFLFNSNEVKKINTLVDYINLCAEEHYWHKKGRIDPRIWKSWQMGMVEWFERLQSLRDMWEQELERKESYYLVGEEDFFRNVN